MSARILIADDSSSARTALKKFLESYSVQWKVCAEAANGLEAVQKAIELKPDLIIMDLQMPVLDGINASARIAKSLPRVPILMNTVHKSLYVDLEATKVGVRQVLPKSDPGTLVGAIEKLLGGRPKSIVPASD
jgi:DNA-binding NarL/FixJ family response regulator